MTDEEAQLLYPIFAQRAKQTPEKSRALPQWQYRNPELNASFKKRDKGEAMDRLSDREIADSLLCQWYRWAKAWRPDLDAKVAAYCKLYTGDERHNEASEDDAYADLHEREMIAVDFCIGTLAVPLQQSIGTEQRNREAKAKVWRDPGNRTYSDALAAVLPKLREHADLANYFCG
jgi:hypothetical protein